MTIQFITPGHINIDAAFTFGVSAKESKNPIGFFGTGLKYAVATLLRTGHTIKVYVGSELHEFTGREMTHRDHSFTTICLDGRSLNFTTELGKQWEPWMAFRELHSNTMDEGGRTVSSPEEPRDDTTIIEVSGSAIETAYRSKSEIFCASQIMAENDSIQIRAGSGNRLYYRGVFASKLPRESLYTYNLIEDHALTEDRTLANTWSLPSTIADAVSRISNRDILARILTSHSDSFEWKLDFDSTYSPGEDFVAVLQQLQHDKFLNPSAKQLGRRLGFFVETYLELDAIQTEQLSKAKVFLRSLGFAPDTYPVVICDLNSALGEARNGIIHLSPRAFRMGTKYVAGTLLEEYLHLSEGVRDETREMQNLLIDTIMTLGEKVVGHPI